MNGLERLRGELFGEGIGDGIGEICVKSSVDFAYSRSFKVLLTARYSFTFPLNVSRRTKPVSKRPEDADLARASLRKKKK